MGGRARTSTPRAWVNTADRWRSPGPPLWWHPPSTNDDNLDCDRVRPFYPQVLGDSPVEQTTCLRQCAPTTPRAKRRFVFIGGPPLHGTTALYGLLSSSSRVSNYCRGARHDGGAQCEGSWGTVRGHRVDKGAWDERWARMYNMSRVLTRYHKHWDPSKCTHMEKSPVNMVWMPALLDSLTEQGIPPSRVTMVMLVRSPCLPPKQAQDAASRAAEAKIMPGLDEHTSLATWQSYLLRLTVSTLQALRGRGAHVVLVDYEMMIQDVDGTTRALQHLLPCVGRLDAHQPQPGFRHQGRNLSLAEYAHSQRHRARRTTCSAAAFEPLQQLGYIDLPSSEPAGFNSTDGGTRRLHGAGPDDGPHDARGADSVRPRSSACAAIGLCHVTTREDVAHWVATSSAAEAQRERLREEFMTRARPLFHADEGVGLSAKDAWVFARKAIDAAYLMWKANASESETVSARLD